jgi:hypothetical protein
MYFLNEPLTALALIFPSIFPSRPGGMIESNPIAVQPHPGRIDFITKLLSPVFFTLKI